MPEPAPGVTDNIIARCRCDVIDRIFMFAAVAGIWANNDNNDSVTRNYFKMLL